MARLTLDGLPDSEIATRRFLSPQSVGWQLTRVFNKLEVRSRAELANALPSADSQPIPA
jgi:DNA-binding CsgD family transcriptional regulator